MRLTISGAFFLAIDGAATAAAAVAVALPAFSERLETLGRTPQLLAVTGALVLANHRRPHHTASRVPSGRTTVPGSIPSSESAPKSGHSEPGSRPDVRCSEPATVAGSLGCEAIELFRFRPGCEDGG
nr:sorbitol dehydrogenase-like [Ipomoea trifida]